MYKILAAFLLLCVPTTAFSFERVQADGITAQEALQRLKDGNARFVNGYITTFPYAVLRDKTSVHGQHPMAVILSCADSRVPPEDVFNQGLGDIFVVRIAGNTQSIPVTGSIEYGVEHLEAPLLVVLGHSQCGAVTAVATNTELHGSMKELLAPIIPAVARARAADPQAKEEALIIRATHENVELTIEELLKSSPLLRRSMKENRLAVVGALYDLRTGQVQWLGPHPQEKKLLQE